MPSRHLTPYQRRLKNRRKHVNGKITPALRNRETRRRNQAAMRQNKRAKLDVIARLGGSCVDCGISDPRVLSVDHLNGDGAAHRRHPGGFIWLRYLKALVTGSHLLALRCLNCHAIKDLFGDPAVHRARVLAGRTDAPADPQPLPPDPQLPLLLC